MTEVESVPDQSSTTNVFLCYRQVDGSSLASWLYGELNKLELDASDDGASSGSVLEVYLDRAAPGYEDWKALHLSHLRTAKALILIATPGANVDHREDGREDFVQEELDWWLAKRTMAPIVVAAPGIDERYVPKRIRERWPDIQRIEIDVERFEREGDDQRRSDRAIAIKRITEAITTSLKDLRFEDLEREDRETNRRRRRLATMAVMAMIIVGVSYAALRIAEFAGDKAQEAFANQLAVFSTNTPVTDLEDREAKALYALESMRRLGELGLPAIDADASLRDAIRFYPRTVHTFRERYGARAVSFSDNDDRVLAVSNYDLVAWNAETGEELIRQRAGDGPAAFSTTGNFLASVEYSEHGRGQIHVFELESYTLIASLPFDHGRIDKVRIDPFGRYVAARSDQGEYPAVVFDVQSGSVMAEFSQVTDFDFTPDGKYIALVDGFRNEIAGTWLLPANGESSLSRVGEFNYLLDALRIRFASHEPTAFVRRGYSGAFFDLVRYSASSEPRPVRRRGTISTPGFPAAIGPEGDLFVTRGGSWTDILDSGDGARVRLKFVAEDQAFNSDGRLIVLALDDQVRVVELTRPVDL